VELLVFSVEEMVKTVERGDT